MAGLQQRFESARSDPGLVVLEGVHALKHAVRFGAEIETVVTPDVPGLLALLERLAPDVAPRVHATTVAGPTWQALTHGGLPSPALAIAVRPAHAAPDAVAAIVRGPGPAPGAGAGRRARRSDDGRDSGARTGGPRGSGARATGPRSDTGPGPSDRVVLLDGPAHLGNVGAAVRVAAAAGAAALVVRGAADPWHPMAVRGGAGLQFALPVGRIEELTTSRPIVTFDSGGNPLDEVDLPGGAVLAFGSERHGLRGDLRERADLSVAIPMRAGVSSLNLATAVAVALYHR